MIIEKIGLWYPVRMRLQAEKMLTYAGISESSENWLGKLSANSVALGAAGLIAAFLVPAKMLPYPPLVMGLAAFVLLVVIGALFTLVLLYYEIHSRTKEIEKFLPDYLELIASNLSAGVSPFDSFREAARPEFGPLYAEVIYVSAKMQGEGSFTMVFRDLSTRVPSKILSRVITVFEKGVRSGSKLSNLLKAIADELRSSREMEETLISSVKSNVIFLAFLLVFVAPFLLAISGQFVRTFKTLDLGTSGGSDPNMLGLEIGGNPYIKTLDLNGIFMGLLTAASIATSALIGLLLDDDPVMGLKYLLPIVIGAVGVFMFSSNAMKSMLGGFS